MSIFKCNIKYNKVKGNSELSSRNNLVAHGFIDESYEILNDDFYKANRELNLLASDKLGKDVNLYQVKNNVAIPNTEVFKEIDLINQKPIVNNQEGIDFVFEQNPELANIGTKEQYAEYIKTIFPESKVQDIVYHGSYSEKIDKFFKEILDRTSLTGFLPKGFYFTNQQYVAATYTASKNIYNRAIWDSLLNVLKGIKGERDEYIQDPVSFEKLLSYIGKSNDEKEFIIDYRDGKLEDSFGGASELGLFLPSKEDTELYLKLLRNKDLKGIESQRDKYSDKEGNIFPVLLNIKNPLNKTSATGSITTINLEGRTTGEKKETLNKELKNSDGLIINNIRDSSDYKPKRNIKYNENIDEQTYVVFEPSQIYILGNEEDQLMFSNFVKNQFLPIEESNFDINIPCVTKK